MSQEYIIKAIILKSLPEQINENTVQLFHATVLCVALALTGLWPVAPQAATQMPSFALESVRDGKIINSDSFRGKVLLLTFFATWCPPCAEEVPVLVKLQNELARPDFLWWVCLLINKGRQ